MGTGTEEVEEDVYGVVPCSSLAVESIIRVGTAGAIWGLCSGPYDARRQGLTGVAQASFVMNSVGRFGFQCGVVAGIFGITRCGIQRYRRRDDWLKRWFKCAALSFLNNSRSMVNGLIAGAVAGAAVAARTRNWTQVIGMACLVSAFSAAADYSRTS